MIDEMGVLRRVVDLTLSMEEGLLHMGRQFDELRIEESLNILSIFVEGVICVDKALADLTCRLPEMASVNVAALGLQQSLISILAAYTSNNLQSCRQSLSNNLLPSFYAWQETIQKIALPM